MVTVLEDEEIIKVEKPVNEKFIKEVKQESRSVGDSFSRIRTEKKGRTVDYTNAVTELLGLPAGVFAAVGAASKNEAFSCDAITIVEHTPTIAQAVNTIAQEDTRVAKVLDKITKVTPYGALISALVPLALQIAANHKKIPAIPQMGIVAPEDLISKFTGEAGDRDL